ncbi:MAG: adenylate kinase [Oscillospiraceae bacterium]|nr:adenylate kinase [Oscillospiraceae bacterium]
MVYLIGGSSHVGKTLLAQKLMERLKIPYLSLDHLKMGFIRTGMTELTVNDDYKMRYWMWPFVAELIKTVCENDQSLIIEGCYIPSEWRESYSPEYLAKIRCVFIVMSENYLRTNFDSVAGKASVIEHRIDDRPDLERLITCSVEFKNEAERHGIPYIEISESFDLEKLADELISIFGAEKHIKGDGLNENA